MKTGDILRDELGHAYEIGDALGRGLWGRSWAAKDESGAARVVKVPLGSADFTDDGERLARACREIALEQGRMLEEGASESLVAIERRFVASDGTPVLVFPRYPATLATRLTAGLSVADALALALAIARALRALPEALGTHGAVRPSNVLFDAAGGVALADPLTPAARPHSAALARFVPDAAAWQAPEVRDGGGPSVGSDTWSVALGLWRGAVGSPALPLPGEGPDKAALVALKDRLRDRLKGEISNPRFHGRLTDRVAALLNRALSREVSPSPPFRFSRADEFIARLEEVQALVRPVVTHVGKVLFPPSTESFATDRDVEFHCAVGCSTGVDTHEEIATGIAIFDVASGERLKSAESSYTVDRHPSGRFRFGFRVAGLPPGAYQVRVAYAVRDSGEEPTTAEGTFKVVAAPGYVPPRTEPEARPIPLDRGGGATTTGRTAPDDAPTGPRSLSIPDLPPLRPPADSPVPAVSHMDAGGSDGPDHGGDTAVAVVDDEPTPAMADPMSPQPVAIPIPVRDPAREGRTPAPPEDDEPQYRGAGRWTDLPLPGALESERGDIREEGSDEGTGVSEVASPTGMRGPAAPSPLARAVAVLRADAYLLFLGCAGVVIVALIIALVALR